MERLTSEIVLRKEIQQLKEEISSLEEITETIYKEKEEAEERVKIMSLHEEEIGQEMDRLADRHREFKEESTRRI